MCDCFTAQEIRALKALAREKTINELSPELEAELSQMGNEHEEY